MMKVYLAVWATFLTLIQATAGGPVATALKGLGLTTLLDVVQKAGLENALEGMSSFTVFAPTNEAFAKVPKDALNALLNDPEALKNVVLYHVIPDVTIKSADLAFDNLAETANGDPVRINVYIKRHSRQATVVANGKEVINADVEVSPTRIVHVIDEVLPVVKKQDTLVEVLQRDGRFGTLLTAVNAAGLASVLADPQGRFTVFAPTDEAFARIPQETLQQLLAPEQKRNLGNILKKHVAGEVLFSAGIFNNNKIKTLAEDQELTPRIFHGGVVQMVSSLTSARIIDADIPASNGVIHAINNAL